MSSNDFGTMIVRPGDRRRNTEALRLLYIRHQEMLKALSADAPDQVLSAEYARLIGEIDSTLERLRRDAMTAGEPEPPGRTAPGSRPLVTPPGSVPGDAAWDDAEGTLPRVALIIAGGALVLVLIGWLMWRAGGERTSRAVRPATDAPAAKAPHTPASRNKPFKAALSIEPAAQDYGAIRKGTRAVRQFQLSNNTDRVVTLRVARSACRCLYYDYAGTIPAHGKETLTVTVDGARAKRESLHESITVSVKDEPGLTVNFEVDATIR